MVIRLRLVKTFFAALGIAVLAVGTVECFSGWSQNSCACSYNGYFDPESLVSDSELIVVAELRSVREVTLKVTHPGSGVTDARREKVSTYHVFEVLKGHERVGETLEIFGVPTPKNSTYVLFLRSLTFAGYEAWSFPGVPGYAALNGDWLMFQATLDLYVQDVESRGQPLKGSMAPFLLTLPGLREMLAAP